MGQFAEQHPKFSRVMVPVKFIHCLLTLAEHFVVPHFLCDEKPIV